MWTAACMPPGRELSARPQGALDTSAGSGAHSYPDGLGRDLQVE